MRNIIMYVGVGVIVAVFVWTVLVYVVVKVYVCNVIV
jgi:hypothetical protein